MSEVFEALSLLEKERGIPVDFMVDLLTHSPAAGLNDGNDRAHKGFACFNDLLEEYQPKWFVHGHVHLSYNANLPRVCTHGQTTVINATERYTFEIPDPDPVARRRFFWNDPAFPTKN